MWLLVVIPLLFLFGALYVISKMSGVIENLASERDSYAARVIEYERQISDGKLIRPED